MPACRVSEGWLSSRHFQLPARIEGKSSADGPFFPEGSQESTSGMGDTSIIEYVISELEVPQQQLDKILRGCPQLLRQSVNAHVRPIVQDLAVRGLSPRQIGKAATIWPMVLSHNTLANAAAVVDLLHDAGVPKDKMAKVILARPQLLALNVVKNLRPKVSVYASVGPTLYLWPALWSVEKP